MMFNLWRFNPFSTWRGDVWFDLESFLNDLIDDWRIWPFWNIWRFWPLEYFFGGFLWFFFVRTCIRICTGNGSFCFKITTITLIPGTLVQAYIPSKYFWVFICKLARYHSHNHCQDLISHCATIMDPESNLSIQWTFESHTFSSPVRT